MIFDEMKTKELRSGWITAFLDRQQESSLAYRPEFVSNDPHQGRKVLSVIDRELAHCDHFALSVAFINEGGITPLMQTLKELEEKRVPGRILTTDYLTFSEPRALERLASLQNIELRMFQTNRQDGGFHTKSDSIFSAAFFSGDDRNAGTY